VPVPVPVPVLPVVRLLAAAKFRIVFAWVDCDTTPFPLTFTTVFAVDRLTVSPLVVVKVALPETTFTLMPHWFRGTPGRHGLITISMMLPLPGAVWASAFQATELASRIAAVALSTTTSLRIGVLSRTTSRAHQGFRTGF
jgi:hypothetical protein